VETADRPLAWRQGNGATAIVFLLDPREAGAVVAADLRARMGSTAGEQQAVSWEGPDGNSWLTHGKIPPTARPDEILRHPSRFGDWTLRRFYPVRVVTSYRLPVLLGGFSLAGLLLAVGVAVISWQRKAARLAEQRVSFVNRVSHELRTPLTNLLLNTDLALDALSVSAAKVRRRLGLIREETARLSRIVDNVQTFARMERGNGDTRSGVCDVAKVVAGLRETFAPLFELKSISCEFDCQIAEEIAIDPDALAQILSNLLSNVEKYAGESVTARVGIFQTNGELVVEVEDSGPGVSAAARKRIFLPFERVGSRVDEGATGTGLGLAISRDLAEAMGGKLELVDGSGGGKFRLSVPLVERGFA
jgi:signal transduction histidine kinase